MSDPMSVEDLKFVVRARRMAAVVPSTRYAAASFDNYKPATKKQAAALATAKRFVRLLPWLNLDGGANLWLIGPPGTGKTHLAIGVLRCAIEDDIEQEAESPYAFISHTEWNRAWKAAARKGAEDQFLERYTQPSLLVLDDVRGADLAEVEALGLLVELRYRQLCKPMIITSNLTVPELRQAIGDRSFDRLREGALLAVLDGASHRARHEWNGPPEEGADE
jgi:DNA replication protein DnaC